MPNNRNMRHLGSAILALGVLALSGQAWAAISNTTANGGSIGANPPTYATQAVIGASGAITVNAGISYTSPTPTATGSYTLTFTLPTGVTLNGSASASTVVNTDCTVSLASGGTANSNFAAFTVTQLDTTACVVSLAQFGVAGATALENTTTINSSLNSAGFNVTSQVTGSSVPGVANEATATAIGAAASATGLNFASVNGQQNGSPGIDLNSPSLGTHWITGGTDQAFLDIGALSYGVSSTTQNATASGAYTFPGTSATITLTGGTFVGISAVYLDGNATSGGTRCKSTASAEAAVSGSIAGTISGNSVTFTGVGANLGSGANPFVPANVGNTATEEVCLYASSQIISANASPFSSNMTIAPTTAQADSSSPSKLEGYVYNGLIQQILYSTNYAPYPAYIRIVNNSGVTVPVLAVVQGDGGSIGSTTVEAGLAPNSNDLVPVQTIITNSGATATNFRTAITLLAPSSGLSSCVNGAVSGVPGGSNACAVSISELQLSPSGTLTQLGSGSSP